MRRVHCDGAGHRVAGENPWNYPQIQKWLAWPKLHRPVGDSQRAVLQRSNRLSSIVIAYLATDA